MRAARERLPGLPGPRGGDHMSRETLAGRVGVVSSTIQKWEKLGLPYAVEYTKLAKELGMTLDELIRGVGSEENADAQADPATEPAAALLVEMMTPEEGSQGPQPPGARRPRLKPGADSPPRA